MHCFTDANTLGCGAVVYLRVQYDNGRKHCSMVMRKSRRVTPVKPVAILRLELTAAGLGIELVGHGKRNKLDFAVDDICYSRIFANSLRS